jgi:hypothetical protein
MEFTTKNGSMLCLCEAETAEHGWQPTRIAYDLKDSPIYSEDDNVSGFNAKGVLRGLAF